MKMFDLKPDEIHFFYTLIDEIKDTVLLDRYRSVISENEKRKVNRYVFEKDKHSCLVTRALLRFVLSACTCCDPELFEFIENNYGKPDLKPGLVTMPVKFNISHSRNVTACALALGSEIGMDIEDHSRKIDLNIADRFFSKPESEYLRSCPDKDRQEVFFDFWTLKESYIKARGMGLSIGLDKFGFKIDKKNVCINFHESLNASPEQWKFFRFSPVENYKAAISIQSDLKNSFKLHIYRCIPFKEIKKQDERR
ncbi:MAG: 4'-phosphopantetheinyl transferase superfamily protein [Desulfobacterales bacterium]|nr:4'-phosphopantetheinyl transferase superfamily protein [Desulfobacterales bacterium]